MKQTTLNLVNLGTIFVLLLSIIFLIKLIVSNKSYNVEQFNNLDDIIENNMEQQPERKRQEQILDKADKSIALSRDKQGRLRFQNADTGGDLMEKYLQDIILSDVGNPNKVLVDNDSNQLPTVIEDNLPQYNHEMRMLTNSKMIKQKYTMAVLKNKIKELTNSLKTIEDIKQEMENLKLPENASKLAILKKTYDN